MFDAHGRHLLLDFIQVAVVVTHKGEPTAAPGYLQDSRSGLPALSQKVLKVRDLKTDVFKAPMFTTRMRVDEDLEMESLIGIINAAKFFPAAKNLLGQG